MRSPHTATKSSPSSPQLEKASIQQQRPNAAKNKINKFIFLKKELSIANSFKAQVIVYKHVKQMKGIFSNHTQIIYKYLFKDYFDFTFLSYFPVSVN